MIKANELRIGNYITGIYSDGENDNLEDRCRVLALDETGEMLNFKIWVDPLYLINKTNKMKVKTKNGIVDVNKSVSDLSEAFQRLGDATRKTGEAINQFTNSNYLIWKSSFRPQSQSIIWTVIIIGLVLVIAEIVWYLNFNLC